MSPPGPADARSGLVCASARAGGKLILLGEHAVVHGQPALVTGISSGVQVTIRPDVTRDTGDALDDRARRALGEAARLLDIPPSTSFEVRVAGDLPVAMGLGSSAAFCVALLRALAAAAGRPLDQAELGRCAHRLEEIFHGTPSGVDSEAAARGGLLWFEAGPPPRARPVRAARPLDLLVLLTASRHETSQTVGSLRERAAAAPEVYRPVFAAIGELVRAARGCIERGEAARLGELMTMNHGLLRACGVSTGELDRAVDAALEAGALGAKLTGGGGGGAAIALAGDDVAGLASALRAKGLAVLEARGVGA